MMRVLLTLWLLMAGAGTLVAGLYLLSDRPNLVPHGFNRQFGSVDKVDTEGGDLESFRILGIQNDSLLLLSIGDGKLYWSDRDLNPLQLNDILLLTPSDFETARSFVRGKKLLLIDYATSSSKTIDLKTGHITSTEFASGFLDGVPCDDDCFLLRVPRPVDGEHVLALYQSGDLVSRFYNFLEKKIDGKFCVDGILFSDPDTKTFAYMYFYRGQIIFIDSLLRLSERLQTIDTISVVDFKLASPHQNEIVTWASPPPVVNNNGSYSGGTMVVESRVKADNESLEAFNSNVVLDFYHLGRGYQGSIYIPAIQGQKVVNFHLLSDLLYVEYTSRLLLYRITLQPTIASR